MELTAGVGVITNNLMELCTFIIRALDADKTKNGVNARGNPSLWEKGTIKHN
jgi:hypothetical protein